jgi:2',3'-cyclic-nucleotide 3'-phosphodiesterase
VKVRFEKVVSQDVFFRRCFIRVGYEGVRELAGVARTVGVIGEEVGDGKDRKFGEETERW